MMKRGVVLAGIGVAMVLVVGGFPLPTALARIHTNQDGAQSNPPAVTAAQYEQDFDELWTQVQSNYAYFDQKATDWDQVRTIYRPRVKEVTTRAQFVALLESVLEELYDSHAHLNTNTEASPRLVPSGADLWAEWRGPVAVLTQVRPGSAAERAGLRPNMAILEINGVEIGKAVQMRLGKSLRRVNRAARDWALRVLLAGRHNEERRLMVGDIKTGARQTVDAGKPEMRTDAAAGPVTHRRIGEGGTFGYIRINNSLGENETMGAFDTALADLKETRGLILDLRDTPSGGNTTVARAIMGRFIDKEGFYQKHSVPAEEREFGVRRSWMEIVSPRGPFRYSAPVVVLVDHWTGSMGKESRLVWTV